MMRVDAACAIAGTIVYIAASVLHGDPPVDDVQRMLDHVGQRPWWRAVHLANILGVLLWVAALTTLTSTFTRPAASHLGRLSQAMLICTSAVFAVYFSIHGFGFEVLGTLAGAGWLVGAILISFNVIIPFTVLAWAWMLGVGVAMWRAIS